MTIDLKRFIMPGKIKIVKAAITTPENVNLGIILNFCALDGKWENDLQKALSKKWRKPQEEYKSWAANTTNFKLGQVQSVAIQSDLWAVNALCMDKKGVLDEKALDTCLNTVLKLCKADKATVHMSHLSMKAEVLQKCASFFSENGINSYIYDQK